jgi:hypothetical protein
MFAASTWSARRNWIVGSIISNNNLCWIVLFVRDLNTVTSDITQAHNLVLSSILEFLPKIMANIALSSKLRLFGIFSFHIIYVIDHAILSYIVGLLLWCFSCFFVTWCNHPSQQLEYSVCVYINPWKSLNKIIYIYIYMNMTFEALAPNLAKVALQQSS